MIQKYKRGEVVYIAKELPDHMSHFKSGVDAIIEYSYAEQCGGDNTESYGVIFPETGSSAAWYMEDQLQLVDYGGEHLIEAARAKRGIIYTQDRSIRYIISKLDAGHLSHISILFLFDAIGHNSSFNRNGEFYALFSDWAKFHPIFLHIKNSKTLDEAKSIFIEEKECLEIYNIRKVYDLFNQSKGKAL